MLCLCIGLQAQKPIVPQTKFRPAPKFTGQDSSAFVVVDTIVFEGHRRTLPVAMLREMNVKPGDTLILRDVPARVERNRQLLYNTGLFNKVDGGYEFKDHRIHFYFQVVERWYLIPIFKFRVEERTIFEWLQDPNTYRLSYGAGVSYRNVTGRNDRLNAEFITGFSQSYNLSYNRPFIFPKQMIGGGIGGYYRQFKEVIANSSTDDDIERVRNEGNLLYLQSGGDINLTKRFTQNNGANVSLAYTYFYATDSLLLTNPRFLSSEGRRQDQYPRLRGELWWDTRDVRPFPLSGHTYSVSAEVVGLGVGTTDFARITGKGYRYGEMPISRWYWALGGQFVWLSGRDIPFPEKASLGQAPVRGFEQYVLNGTFFATVRGELRYELFERQIVSIKWLPRQFEDFMTGVYPFIFIDNGYNNDYAYNKEENRFRNRMLTGYGVGVDIPYIYDNLLRIEYALNNYGDRQFMLQFGFALQ